MLLLVMLLTATTAWADEVSVSNVNELSNAVMYGVTEDRTITLTGDNKEWTLTQTLGALTNYKITIDLNGHTITSESILFRIFADTDLTIMDSGEGGSLVYTGGQLTSAIGVNSGGKLTIKSGEISSPNSLAIQNSGTLTITGGTINNSLYGIRNTGIANISNCTITCSEFSVFNDAVSNYSGNYIGNLTIGSGVTLNGDVYNHYNAKINATAKAYVPGAPVKAHSDVDPEDVLPGGSYYASLIDAVNAANNATNDITIKMLDDEDLGIEFVAISNTNHIDGDNTNPIVKVTLDLNGHTVSSTGTTVININQRANVEITDFSDEKNGTICGRSNSATSIENYGTLSVSNIKIINTDLVQDNTNVTKKGIFTHDNSTLTIGSGVSFSNLKYGIYTYYNEEQGPWKARAMTRTVSNEPAKLYINALPTFESCIYDIELINDIIMDFSKATAPLALVDGQKKITLNHFNPSPVKIFTKDYKRAFTNPTTGVITNPNDIFEYYYGESYGEIYYAFGEAIFSSKNDTHLSVVTSDASGTISNLFGYLETRADDSNTYLITALKNLENGGTVQLFSDITGATKPYVINKGTAEAPVTLDLNGHTITGDMTIESGSTLILTDSSNGNGHINGAISVPVDALQNCLTNWSDKADVIKSTGYCGLSTENEGKNLIWTVMPTGEKNQNIPLYALNISVNPDVENQTNFDMMVTDYRNPSCDPWSGIRYLITELNIGEGVTKITPFAFCNLISLTSVIIPKSVEYIDEVVFGNDFYQCPNLKWVYLKRNEPTAEKKITNLNYYEDKCNTFLGCPNLKYIIVDNMEAYKNATTADGWDDAMKAKLREGKPTLFATGATNEWMTWCSNIEYTKPEGCTVYTVRNVTNDVVNLKLWEGENLPAFVPVLIKREAGQLSADIKAEFKDVPAEPENDNASTDGTEYTEIYIGYRYDSEGTIITYFTANYDNYWGTIYANSGAVLNPDNTNWVHNNNEESTYVLYGDKFLKVDTDEGIPTNHWILRIRFKNGPHTTRSLSIGYGDEDTTSIDEVRCQMADGEWYDLQGRRLDSKPTQKGLYINNGKKIVIK